jgi:sulfate adenylyltransferase subunit 2
MDTDEHGLSGSHPCPSVFIRGYNMSSYHLDHLQYLETEAIHVMREVAAEFERPALLFSGGKDSICLLRLAEKAFRPAEIPMPFLNIETGHEFPELIDFRDRRAKQLGAKLLIRTVDDVIARGLATPKPGIVSRNQLQTPALLGAIEEFQFDCCIGGARRDEEKARAKERFFSFRDGFGQWDPKNQRPEIWNLYNARLNQGENMRVFPLSNWTEMDVWEYIKKEQLEVPTIYFSHERECFRRGGQWIAVPPPHADSTKPDPFDGARPKSSDVIMRVVVRVRTIADMISTGMIESKVYSIDDIIAEIAAARVTERGSRADDKASEAAMEDRKKAGYF